MRNHLPNLDEVLDTLERLYGPQKAAGPSDPYEMILYLNSGYPATDGTCSKGFDALKREVGLKPGKILAAAPAKLAKCLRLGGIVPELRAKKLKEIARIVNSEFDGDLKAVLKKCMQEEKKQRGQGGSRCEKSTSEFSRDRGTGRGQNSALCKAGSGGSGAVGVRRGAGAALVWSGREKLRRRLPQGAGQVERGAPRNVRSSAKGVHPAEEAWPRNRQEGR